MRIVRVIVALLIILMIAGCGTQPELAVNSDEINQQTEKNTDNIQIVEEDAVSDAITQDLNTNNSNESLEELVAMLQQSNNISVELVEKPGTETCFPDEDQAELKSCFTTENLKPVDYQFRFIPEYLISCPDTSVQFYIMQDNTSLDFNLYLLQFAGSDAFYSVDQTIYHPIVRVLSYSTKDNMSLMHVFANGDDAQAATDAVLKVNGVNHAAYEYFEKNGYTLASMLEDDIFRVDGYTVEDMSVIDPRLSSVWIEYSVKTVSEAGEDTWVTNNVFVGAVWVEQNDSQARAYLLGVEPYLDGSERSYLDMSRSIFQNSFAQVLVEYEQAM